MSTERRAPRFATEELVRARWSNGGIHETAGVTRDISTIGVFFCSNAAPKLGKELELLLTFPAEVTGGEPRTLLCKGRVVRLEPAHDGETVGVAVEFHSFAKVAES